MKKKLWYIIPLLLLILGLLGPAINNNIHSKNTAPVDTANSIASPPPPAPVSFGEPGSNNANATVPPTNDDPNSSSVEEEANTTAPPSTEPGQESLSLPAESTGSQAVTASIAVVGKDGELLFGPGQVRIQETNHRETTVLGLLASTGLSYEVSKRYPDFVESIAGQRNKGQAGWLYSINDEVPLIAANKKPVAAGDHVIWWYSRSINDPAPKWEQLTND